MGDFFNELRSIASDLGDFAMGEEGFVAGTDLEFDHSGKIRRLPDAGALGGVR